jgi:hypothetical protein
VQGQRCTARLGAVDVLLGPEGAAGAACEDAQAAGAARAARCEQQSCGDDEAARAHACMHAAPMHACACACKRECKHAYAHADTGSCSQVGAHETSAQNSHERAAWHPPELVLARKSHQGASAVLVGAGVVRVGVVLAQALRVAAGPSTKGRARARGGGCEASAGCDKALGRAWQRVATHYKTHAAHDRGRPAAKPPRPPSTHVHNCRFQRACVQGHNRGVRCRRSRKVQVVGACGLADAAVEVLPLHVVVHLVIPWWRAAHGGSAVRVPFIRKLPGSRLWRPRSFGLRSHDPRSAPVPCVGEPPLTSIRGCARTVVVFVAEGAVLVRARQVAWQVINLVGFKLQGEPAGGGISKCIIMNRQHNMPARRSATWRLDGATYLCA